MPDLNDFYAFKSIGNNSGGSGGSGGGDFGCGCIVAVIVAALLLFALFDGADWEFIEGVLSFGIIAFVFALISFR
ncbi:MAG: hypothetical protein J6S13_02315 [Clostridia bacterium]|nr:hypothetical protein [Clostridia bacterium]